MDKSPPVPYVAIHAKDVITDPELVSALMRRMYPPEPDPNFVPIETRLDLLDGTLVLYFSGPRLVLYMPEPCEQFPFYPLHYFLIYRSRVHYNVFYPAHGPQLPNGPEPPSLSPSADVTFHMQKLLVGCYGTEPYTVTVTRQELEDVVTLCTPYLYFALAYYLIGCENPRYFLIEFYKAIESIENAFGGERQAIDALKSYGVTAAVFKRVKYYADHRQQPLDIGRHAPLKGTDLRVIDIRRILSEPLSYQVYSESVSAVRQVIDAYFALLRSTGIRHF